MNIVQLAQSVPDLSTLVSALVAGKLTDVLSGPGPFTVFAPTNEAFAKLPTVTLTRLLDPKNIKELDDLLKYHVLAGAAPLPGKTLYTDYKTVESATMRLTRFCTDRKCGRSKIGINTNTTAKAYPYEAIVQRPEDNLATNGVVHIIDTVLIPPVFPSANHLFFRSVPKGGGTCGEVDAAPRMPASLFDPSNAAALKQYEDITTELYGITTGVQNLEVGQCKDIGYTSIKVSARSGVQWAPSNLMTPICAKKCHCAFTSTTTALLNSTLPSCVDLPDKPKRGSWCSLCGPKYNQPVVVDLCSKPRN